MDSATRLYERLGEIPEDPDDPECLDDLLVCAFGAFERYYVCWKTKGGEYRQDGYDLPPDLKDWLFPADGTSRDFPTLQVVFGRGEEYFASDKNGKLEYKEPEKKPVEEEKVEKQQLKRSRTVSFFRPRSESSTRSVTAADDSAVGSRRSSNASSQPMSRPPSMSFPTRPLSDASSNSQPVSRPPSTSFSRTPSESSFVSQPTSRTSSGSVDLPRPPSDSDFKQMDPVMEAPASESPVASPVAGSTRVTRRSRPLSMSFNQYAFPKIAEESQPPVPERRISQARDPGHCTCGCHDPPLPSAPKPKYRDSSMQTDPMSPTPRTALRIDTTNTSNWPSYSNTSSAEEIRTPPLEEYPAVVDNPLLVGRMMNFFSNPGYQLGDSLTSSYYYYPETQKGYQYEEQYIEEAVHY